MPTFIVVLSCLVKTNSPLPLTAAVLIPDTLPASTILLSVNVNCKRPANVTVALLMLKPSGPIGPCAPVSPFTPLLAVGTHVVPFQPKICPLVTPVVSTSVSASKFVVGAGIAGRPQLLGEAADERRRHALVARDLAVGVGIAGDRVGAGRVVPHVHRADAGAEHAGDQ